MKREKTALDATVSDKEKQDTYTKLMREQTAVLQHKQESQRKQEEMVSRSTPTRTSSTTSAYTLHVDPLPLHDT